MSPLSVLDMNLWLRDKDSDINQSDFDGDSCQDLILLASTVPVCVAFSPSVD